MMKRPIPGGMGRFFVRARRRGAYFTSMNPFFMASARTSGVFK